MRDEIQAGLKNALERGATLEEAIQSFVSAGYNPFEVKEAASSISVGATNIVLQNSAQKQPTAFQSVEKNIQNTSVFAQQSQKVQQPQPTQQPTQIQQKQVQFSSTIPAIQSQIQPQQIQQKSSTKKTLIIMLIILLVVLLAGLGLLITFSDNILKFLKISEFWRIYGI